MRTSKFSFVPEHQIGDEPNSVGGYRVAIRKNGVIYFPADVVRVYELEGKYLRLFADVQKKAIAWTIFNEGDPTDMVGLRLMKRTTKTSPVVVLSIGKLLKKLGFEKGVEFPVLDVKTYVDPLVKGDMWYVTLEKSVL